MNKEHVKEATDKAKGVIEETVGKVTGDKHLQAEGKMDKAEGDSHVAFGDAVEVARRAPSWNRP
jgi:uncharacterized protein YjbJ (UPF0337 family)